MPARPLARHAASDPSRAATLALADRAATDRFATGLALRLSPGDTLLLSGPVGAGKSHLCRAILRTLLETPEDIPSPTYTLVQDYATTAGALWHADLYRLSGPDEVIELGLIDAFETAICLVEWPDRLGALAPPAALALTLVDPQGGDPEDGPRALRLDWSDPRWDAKLDGLLA